MNRLVLARTAALLAAVLLAACGPSPDKITLSLPAEQQGPLRSRGQQLTLTARVVDKKGQPLPGAKLKWVSTAPEVASVEDGVVRALRSGKTEIVALGGRGVRGALPLEVAIPGAMDLRSGDTDFLEEGRSLPLTVSLKNELGQRMKGTEPEFGSSDPAVARVENGRILGVSPGQATLTVTVGPMSRRLHVRVVRNDFVRMALTETHVAMERKGQRHVVRAQAFNAKGLPIDGVPFSWFSSDWSVATVDEHGVITAVGPGRSVVTATAGRRRAAAEVVVKMPEVATSR
ncbi:MAG TPA: Ig-like domain-containing protein [Aggregicoccus sp.]|nr:Ig-like domain-containing protein [Aggregicoccus sp.]